MKTASIYFLTSFLSLFLSISSAAGAACRPVVYAFRHAEDYKEKSALTPIGEAHADLYPAMVTSFEDDFDYNNNYCPAKFVYSVNRMKPTSPPSPGTINPYETARPLAEIVMEGPTLKVPIETIGGKILDEYLNDPSKYPAVPKQCFPGQCVTSGELRAALLTHVTGG
jgi:hypothetical protein